MQNGCICCTLREDLLEEVTKLAREGRFDYLVIESTGVSEPMQVAETFTFELADGSEQDLSQLARLDTCVTVVDVANFRLNWNSPETLTQRFKATEEDERNVIDLMTDQLEFANVIILNKCDLVSPEEVAFVDAVVRRMNATAKVIRTTHSQVDLSELLNTGSFDFDRAADSPGWLQELRGEHVPETLEYGIGSFVYKARKPFHPQRIRDFVERNFLLEEVETQAAITAPDTDMEDEAQRADHEVCIDTVPSDEAADLEESKLSAAKPGAVAKAPEHAKAADSKHVAVLAARDRVMKSMTAKYGQILRSKGFFWLATRATVMGEWSQAGVMLRTDCVGPWFSEVPREKWPKLPEAVEMIEATMEGKFGDRRQELVFIGADLKQEQLTADLDACLLTKEELAIPMENWPTAFADPWMKWLTASEMQAGLEDDDDEDEDGDIGMGGAGHDHAHCSA